MKKAHAGEIFGRYAPEYRALGYAPIPVERSGKRPLLRNWTAASTATIGQILALAEKFPRANVGLLAGSRLPNDRIFTIIDVDDVRWVSFINAIAPAVAGKVGLKGLTNFYQA